MSVRTAVFVVYASAAVSSAATLRVADWNMANHPNNAEDNGQLSTILGYAGTAKPIDLLAMAETDTASAPVTATVFDSVFGGTYASVVAPADGGGDRTGFVYNTAALTLVDSATVGATTLKHPVLRAQFRPIGTSGAEDLFVYATHLTSGSSGTIKATRVSEATIIRADTATLTSAANVIVTGDFNWQKADDVSAGVGAYRTFAAAGTGQVVDPLNQVGDWHGNAKYASLMTEDPGANLDDRFDMQLVSPTLMNGTGLDYLPGSYHVLGNDGTTLVGGIVAPSATMSAAVVAALDAFSDHLPVLADYSYGASDPSALYFAGATSNSLNVSSNYTTSPMSSATSPAGPGGGTDVYFASTNAQASTANTMLNSNLSVNSLTFGNGMTAGAITISGSGTLTIDAGSVGYAAGTGIVKQAGSVAVTISTPIAIGASQSWTNSSTTLLTVSGGVSLGAQTLTLAGTGNTTVSGAITGGGGVAVVGSGVTTLSGANTYAGTTTVNNAAANLRVATAAAAPLFSGAGGADIANGQVAFIYSGATPAASIRALLVAGRRSNFTIGQLRSSTGTTLRGLGYKDDGTAVIVKATLYGDADLDGGVSITDFNALANSFGQSGKAWVDGDFDYDGGVTITDFNLLAANFGQTLNASGTSADLSTLLNFAVAHDDLAAFAAATGVPEPTTLGLAAISGAVILRRRRISCATELK